MHSMCIIGVTVSSRGQRRLVRLGGSVGFARHTVFLLVLSCFGSNVDSFLRLITWIVELVTNKPECFRLFLFSSDITYRRATARGHR